MKKIVCLIFAILLVAWWAYATVDTKDGTAITTGTTLDGQSGIDTVDGQTIKSSVLFDEYFTHANDADVAGNTEFDTETDSGKLSINDNKMRFSADTADISGYVNEDNDSGTTWADQTEFTIKFKITFSHITAIDDGSGQFRCISAMGTAGDIGYCVIMASSGDIAEINAKRYVDGGGSDWIGGQAISITATAEYDCYLYWKKDGSAGVFEWAIYDDTPAWIKVTASGLDTDDDSNIGNLDNVSFGGVYNEWGDDTNDALIDFDDFEIYSGDERP